MEVIHMSKRKNKNRGTKISSSVNPQGNSEDVADQQAKSQLEERAKKKNTKI